MTEQNAQTVSQITEIIEACQHWHSALLMHFFYSQSVPSGLPDSYGVWINQSGSETVIQKALIDEIRRSADDLNISLNAAKSQTPPAREVFEKFTQSYDRFLMLLNKAQNELAMSGSGMDDITGFKIGALMIQEVKRELDRRGRNGNPFSMAMIRLDGENDFETRNFKLRAISTALRQGLRSFDDVYRLENDDLVIALKHADIKGGFRFIERLKSELKNLQAEFTFSSCVAEPDPSDDLQQFLKNLLDDLNLVASSGSGQTMKYEELSPLQRFVTNMKDK